MKNTAIDAQNERFDEAVWNASKILVVDDEDFIRRTVKRTLELKGIVCFQAASAEEARILLKDMCFDLILSDLKMPGESGMDFIAYVLKEYPETAVIMLTGVDDPEIAESALEIGAYGYIIKPFKPTELIINVSNALRRRKVEIENRE